MSSERIERPARRGRGRPPGALTKGRVTYKARVLGAHSRYYRASGIALLDRRTVQSKFLERVRDELIAHVGGSPTVVQRMLIDRASVLSLRLAQIDRKIYDEIEFTQIDNHCAVAWSNCLTRTLVALGIHPQAALNGVAVSFDDVLAEINRSDEPPQPPASPQSAAKLVPRAQCCKSH